MKKKIPKFETDDEEREFWTTHDSTEYVDWEKAKKIRFAEVKPSAKTNYGLVAEAAEDAEDLAVFDERAKEPNLDFKDVLKDLKQRGRI